MRTYTAKEVLEFYFALTVQERYRGRWALSSATVEALKEQVPELIPHGWPITELQLVGAPIEIHDEIPGLAFASRLD